MRNTSVVPPSCGLTAPPRTTAQGLGIDHIAHYTGRDLLQQFPPQPLDFYGGNLYWCTPKMLELFRANEELARRHGPKSHDATSDGAGRRSSA